MDWMNKVGGILQQYAGSSTQGPGSQPPADVSQHFDNVAQAVPQNVLAQGLSEAFHSNQTPAFGEMVGNLFAQSNSEQKAGILNKLLAAAGPSTSAWLASKGLSGLVNGPSQVNSQAVSQVEPNTVSELAEHARKQDPSFVDDVSDFTRSIRHWLKGWERRRLPLRCRKYHGRLEGEAAQSPHDSAPIPGVNCVEVPNLVVMIVDDHAVIRRMLRAVLEAESLVVTDATDGAEGVRKAQVERPDLIILDLSMPVMNGLEAARELKVLMPDVPLLMFTNNSGAAMQKEAHDAGIFAVISKSDTDGSQQLVAHAKTLLGLTA